MGIESIAPDFRRRIACINEEFQPVLFNQRHTPLRIRERIVINGKIPQCQIAGAMNQESPVQTGHDDPRAMAINYA